MHVFDQLRQAVCVFLIERNLWREITRLIADIIDRRQSRHQLRASAAVEDRVGRRGNQNQQRPARLLQSRQAFCVRGDHGVKRSADDRGPGLRDAGSLGGINDLRS